MPFIFPKMYAETARNIFESNGATSRMHACATSLTDPPLGAFRQKIVAYGSFIWMVGIDMPSLVFDQVK